MKMQVPEIKVSFSLTGMFGIEVNLDKITKEMSIEPTDARTPDDWPEAIKNPKTELPDELKPHYVWHFDVGYESGNLVRDRFDVMLRFLAGKKDIINDLKKQFSLSASFTIGIHAQHDPCNMPELFLTQEIVAFAASIGADIGFDMYLD